MKIKWKKMSIFNLFLIQGV